MTWYETILLIGAVGGASNFILQLVWFIRTRHSHKESNENGSKSETTIEPNSLW